MKASWTRTWRRLAASGGVLGVVTLSPAVCYASVITAFDIASDPVYADGWQAGDNGGFGFTPWNFDSTFFDGSVYIPLPPGIHSIDDGLQSGGVDSSPFNAIGTAWRLAVEGDGAPQAGRGFDPLEIGQTLEITIDNPGESQFFKGYLVRLSGGTGGVDGNICSAGEPCTAGGTPSQKMLFLTFEYFTFGEWSVSDSGSAFTGVFDTHTSEAGAIFQVTRTGAESYDVLMDSLGSGPSYAASRTFSVGAPVDWIEFFMFGVATNPDQATDFYISSMRIMSDDGAPDDGTPVPEPGSMALFCVAGAVGAYRRWRSRR